MNQSVLFDVRVPSSLDDRHVNPSEIRKEKPPLRACMPSTYIENLISFYGSTYCSLAVKQNSYLSTSYIRIKRQQGLQTTHTNLLFKDNKQYDRTTLIRGIP